MGLAWGDNCDPACRYHYRGRCIHGEPMTYVQPDTALCLERADALIVQAEAIAAEAWAQGCSEYAGETERLALLAKRALVQAEEPVEGIDWRLIAGILSCAAFWVLVVIAGVRVWRG